MSYNIKYIRLVENSPFKKINKSSTTPKGDLSVISKITTEHIINHLTENLYYILHLFYVHTILCGISYVSVKPSLTGIKILTQASEGGTEISSYYNRLFVLTAPSRFKSNDIDLTYIKNNVKIKLINNVLNIKMPCIFEKYRHSNIFVLNSKNEMTIKDIYVNQLKYIIQYGYTDKNVQTYFNHLLNLAFGKECDIDIYQIFDELHKYLNICDNNIDIKYVIADNKYSNNLNLNLIDIQSINDIYESFLSVFEIDSFKIDNLRYVTLLNSFVASTDYRELHELLKLITNSGTCQYLYTVIVNDNTQLLKYISKYAYAFNIVYDMCKNITMYNYYGLNDLSIIPSFIKERATLLVENPKKCSFKTDILFSVLSIENALIVDEKFKNNVNISKFDIFVALCGENIFGDLSRQKRYDKIKSSIRIENNTNKDEYSKFIKKLDIVRTTRNKIAIECDVVLTGA